MLGFLKGRRFRRILLGVVVVGLGLGICAAAFGGLERLPSDRARAIAFDQRSMACWSRAPRTDRRLLTRCVRLHGRVIVVRDWSALKADALVLSGFRPYIARIGPGDPRPSIGSMKTFFGPLVRARNGMSEVQVFATY